MQQGLSVYPGYASKYAAQIVRQYASVAADNIQRRMRETGADTIVVQGTSGVSIGFAALMLHDFPLVMVRKPDENSHGSPVEGPRGHKVKRYIILDDFVDTGDTVRRIAAKLNLLADNGERTARNASVSCAINATSGCGGICPIDCPCGQRMKRTTGTPCLCGRVTVANTSVPCSKP